MSTLGLRLLLSQFRAYATTTYAYKAVRFRARRAEHSIFERLRDEYRQSRITRDFLTISIATVLCAIVLLVALIWFERKLTVVGYDTLSSALDDIFTSVMIGIASIGAVFIGLYYAAISAIVTRAYGDVPTEVRGLLAGDIAGRTYMRLLTFLTCFALVSLFAQFAFGYLSRLAVILALLMSSVAVVAFVALGNRAFHLLDASTFVREVRDDFEYWAARSSRRSLRSLEPEFQNHARVRADRALTTMEAISRSVAGSSFPARTIPGLCAGLHVAHLQYLKTKALIPVDSLWYPRTHAQRRWYVTSDSVTSIAAQTGTGLMPETRIDRSWVERRLDALVLESFQTLVNARAWNEVGLCLAALAQAFQERARLGHVVETVASWRDLANRLSRNLSTAAIDDLNDVVSIGIMDALASIPISIAIGLRQYLEEQKPEQLDNLIQSLRDSASRYRFETHPYHHVELIEWLTVRIDFERLAEGRTVSPGWYFSELLHRIEVQFLRSSLDALLKSTQEAYEECRSAVAGKRNGYLEAALLERQFEYFSKTQISTDLAVARFQLLTANRRITGLKWASIDPTKVEQSLRAARDAHEDRMAGLLIGLVKLPYVESIPDFGGHFLAAIADSTFSAAATGNDLRLKKLFPVLVAGSLVQFDVLRSEIKPDTDLRLDPNFNGSIAAASQVADIAGYVRVFADLLNKPAMWDDSKKVLDLFLKVDAASSARYWQAILSVSAWGGFAIPHMSTYRMSRRQELSRQLAPLKKPVREAFGVATKVEHASPIVCAMDDFMGLGAEGLDVFALVYVHEELGVPIAQLGHRVRSIAQKLRRAADTGAEPETDED